MHWTLGELRDMAADEYDALIAWAQDKNKDPDSIDADEIVKAKRQKDTDTDA